VISPAFAGLIADARKLIARVSNLPGDEKHWKPEHHDQWRELNRELDQLAHGAGSASVRGFDPDGEGEAEFIKVLEERLQREDIEAEIARGKQDARAKLAVDAQSSEIKKKLVVQKGSNGLKELLEKGRVELEAATADPKRRTKATADAKIKEIVDAAPAEDLKGLEPDRPRANGRSTIKVEAGEYYKAASETEEALIGAGAEIYQRGSKLVRPLLMDVAAPDGRVTKIGQLIPVPLDNLLDSLSRHSHWVRYNPTKEKYTTINPVERVAKIVLARSGGWGFRRASGVIMTPTLRPDGSLLIKPGFDEQTGLILLDPPKMPPVSMEPTKDEAVKALGLLMPLLAEFPFVDEASRSVGLSTLITPVVKIACGPVPMHTTTAPSPSNGKSYMFHVATAIATGHKCPAMGVAKSETETEKRLGAAILAGQPIIHLDNVDVALGGAFLCQMISEEFVQVRKLGVSEQFTYPNTWCVFANGNNLALLGDVTRRVLQTTIDHGEERGELRVFKAKPFEMVLANRGLYVAACLTIVLAYRAAGMPGKLPPLASFDEWSDQVRSALVWLDQRDPVETVEKVRVNDPDWRATIGLFQAIEATFGVGPENARFASQILKGSEALKSAVSEIFADIFNEPTAVHLGLWLKSKADRVVGGLKLKCRYDSHLSTRVWWVERVSGTPAPSAALNCVHD
jgi:putative DNA primase/helicase